MKITGLITEYNPFHNGHLYHINKARELTNADFVIVVMSGDFVQRGYPAIVDKFTRANMALAEGADLVLELPSCYATSSAEYFALGAVSLLEHLGCVDSLVFGSECGDLSSLASLSDILYSEPPMYQSALKEALAKGFSYPAARIQAIHALPSMAKDCSALLKEPNNILAIEYLKALKRCNSSMTPYTIKRSGEGYHSENLHHGTSSATAIRKILLSSEYALEETSRQMYSTKHHLTQAETSIPSQRYSMECGIAQLKHQIPAQAYSILLRSLAQNKPMDMNAFSEVLSYALILNQHRLTDYLDIDTCLANRICNHLHDYTTITAFADLIKNKAYTHTRITRALSHILLNLTKEDMGLFLQEGISFYGRALGFRRSAAPLLKQIKTQADIPLITKLSQQEKHLSSAGMCMLSKDLQSSQLYMKTQKKDMAYNEYTKPLIIL